MRLLLALLVASLVGSPADRYADVTINADGSVTVSTEDGRQITLPTLAPYAPAALTGAQGMKHVGAEQAVVSPDRQSVGWLALFENCTSYPLPLKLVILHNGRISTLQGEASIWFWSFQNAGKRAATCEELPHRGQALHYDLWDRDRPIS